MTYEQLQNRYDNEGPEDYKDDDKCECCGQRKCVCVELDEL